MKALLVFFVFLFFQTPSFGQFNCIDSSAICITCICPAVYAPVCGCDGVTYGNSCLATNNGVLDFTTGACSAPPPPCQGTFQGQIVEGVECLLIEVGEQLYLPCSGPPELEDYQVGDFVGFDGILEDCPSFCQQGIGINISCIVGPELIDCIDTTLICLNCPCPNIYSPVCGCDGLTYSNSCEADAAGLVSYTDGACTTNICDVVFSPYLISANTYAFNAFSQTNGSIYLWDFGDNQQEVGQKTMHTYASSGWYTICVVMVNEQELCYAEFCDSVYISNGCIDSSIICAPASLCCDAPFSQPVCGCDGVTYENPCVATLLGGVLDYTEGACGSDTIGCQGQYSGVAVAGVECMLIQVGNTQFMPCDAPTAWNLYNVGDSITFDGYFENCVSFCQQGSGFVITCIEDSQASICIDSSLICTDPICCDFPLDQPVCGCDGVTYAYPCLATLVGGVTSFTEGACTSSATDKFGATNIKLFPNPAITAATLSFEWRNPNEEVQLGLYNALGQKIMSDALFLQENGIQTHEIDLTTIPKGTYWVLLQSSRGTTSKMLSIQ